MSGNIDILMLGFCSKLQCILWALHTRHKGREADSTGLGQGRTGDYQQCQRPSPPSPLQSC